MEFRVLGPIEVAAGERRTAPSSGRRRRILAVLLAACGDPVSTDRLVDAVWEADPPSTARKSLQSHVSRLRGELADLEPAGADVLASTTNGYRIEVSDHRLDAASFETLRARAQERHGADPEEALALLDEALGLWRGPAFGDLSSLPVVRDEAVRLEGLRSATVADRVDVQLTLGRHAEVVGELEATAARDHLDERAHGQLMLALYGAGRQVDALATYRGLQARLREELGVDPSPELRELHERVLQHDQRLLADASSGAQPVAPATRGRSRPPELIGREDDLAAVTALLREARLVTLTGPGGVGKTRLAEAAAAQVGDAFDDGLEMGALAGVREPELVAEAMITSLGIQPTGDHSPIATLVSALGQRRLLLLLDNCEHVLAPVAGLVEEILDRCPGVTVLATSRERLHLPDEHVWQVPPLPVPRQGATPEEILSTPAGRLFQTRAQAAEPTFELTDRNATAVVELCRRLDGMPLAIELAAARIRAMSPDDLVARLDRRFAVLAGGPRHEAGRHRTLQSVVAWSYDLLEVEEARLFDRLSVFAGRFSLDAAEAVCGDTDLPTEAVAGLLGELVDKSMVVVERREGVVGYRLLDTLREYAARRLEGTGQTTDLRRAHASHQLGVAVDLGRRVRGPEEREAVAGVDATFDDLRAAHSWMVEDRDVHAALALPAALVDYTFYRLRDEITSWARRAVALPGAAADPSYAAALATAAQGATSRDDCVRARREAEEALAQAGPDDMAAVSALGALGTVALYEGDLEEVREVAARQAKVAEGLDDGFHRAFAGVLHVLALSYSGQTTAAIDAVGPLQEIADAVGSPTMVAFARYCRGETRLDLDPEDAAESFERAIALARGVRNALIEGVSLVSLASLRARRGETATALRLFRDVISHWRRVGDHTHQVTTVRNLVQLLAEAGALEPAAALHGAVTTGTAPSFGAEARRLEQAWDRLRERLGSETAVACARRGRGLTTTQMEDEAITAIDALLTRG